MVYGSAQLDVFVQTVDKKGVLTPGFIRELDTFATKASALSGVRCDSHRKRHTTRPSLQEHGRQRRGLWILQAC